MIFKSDDVPNFVGCTACPSNQLESQFCLLIRVRFLTIIPCSNAYHRQSNIQYTRSSPAIVDGFKADRFCLKIWIYLGKHRDMDLCPKNSKIWIYIFNMYILHIPGCTVVINYKYIIIWAHTFMKAQLALLCVRACA